MKISARTQYACLAMMELAARYGEGRPVQLRVIAEQHNIPSHFLVQILLQLKAAGFVSSSRGASGGYRLVRSPEKITLREIMAVIEGDEAGTEEQLAGGSRPTQVLCRAWCDARDARLASLDSVTLEELVEQTGPTADRMYYI
jgi:Rrf2 family protein